MFRITIYSIVISLIFISVMSQASYPAHPIQSVNDEPEEISVVDFDDGEYVENLVIQLTDCNLEKRTHDSEKLRTQLESLYKETLVARGLSDWVPLHLPALSKHRKEKCALNARK